MEIKQLQVDVDQWIKTIGVKYFSELTNMAILTKAAKKVHRLSRVKERQRKNTIKQAHVNYSIQKALAYNDTSKAGTTTQ